MLGGVVPDATLFLAPLFFGVSFFYSSVGFGGGSSYIAILVLFGISLFMVPPISLILNIVASSMALFNYARAGHLSLSLSAPFLASVPFAFASALIVLSEKQLALIFVVAMYAASAALLISGGLIRRQHERVMQMNVSRTKLIAVGVPTGSALGVLAGIVGIGGGIWLSPLLILSGLADPKKAAATASLFILANSISGFAGHSIGKELDLALLLPLALVVLAGGIIGSRFGAFKFDHDKIRVIVGGLVAVAATLLLVNQFMKI